MFNFDYGVAHKLEMDDVGWKMEDKNYRPILKMDDIVT